MDFNESGRIVIIPSPFTCNSSFLTPGCFPKLHTLDEVPEDDRN